MPNRLVRERNPYLLQHANNPVDWYPWGTEALEKARRESKPIFLSIGYAACHWCHVMAHESFEDPDVAAILNEHFVSIKVDREERPDIDRIYMAAVQAMTGFGGWPLSIFLTPEGQPFYGGTYFPPEPRHGMPAFRQILLGVIDAWQNRREEVLAGGQVVQKALEQRLSPVPMAFSHRLDEETRTRALHALRRWFDPVYGGWGGAPKFPMAQTIAFLLRVYAHTGDDSALAMSTRSLEAMARGSIYDQLGGGFHRYAVDARWEVPHFEKMLYDQALLVRAYLQAWQCTGEPLFRSVVEETLDFVAREMTVPAGGFCCSLDADSEGKEGKFYLWQEEEIRTLLGTEADRFVQAYRLVGEEHLGAHLLAFVGTYEERVALGPAKHLLWAAREARVRPARDEKVLASWNGLMLAAFAEAARVLGRLDYQKIAERNAAFLLEEMRRADGRLWHTWIEGHAAVPGLLEDYTHVIDGWLELYQTTFDVALYRAAYEAMQVVQTHFPAPEGGFFDTSDDHEPLIVRPRELQDTSIPSGNAMAALDLLRLARLAVEPDYAELARRAIAPMQPLLATDPLGFSHWLVALEQALATPVDVAIAGVRDAPDTQRLLAVCRQGYRPDLLVALGVAAEDTVPLLEGRHMREGHAQAYVCRGGTCLPPTGDPDELVRLLAPQAKGTL